MIPSEINECQQYHTNKNLLRKMVTYSVDGILLIEKFTINYILEYFDRNKMEDLSTLFENFKKKLDITQFVRFMINAIHHRQEETIYLINAIVDLFKQINQFKNKDEDISFLDFTNYYCQKIVENTSNNKLESRLVPNEKVLNPDVNRVREIDVNAPVIHEKIQFSIPKIIPQKIITDKTSHSSGPVSEIAFSSELNLIMTLDTLSSKLKLFSTSNLSLKNTISPLTKNSKQVAILSFAYSKKQKRVGILIKDIGMSFFEIDDNFGTEKLIGRILGQKIYYLEFFEQWVTTDKGRLHFWDIKEETVKYTIGGKQDRLINTICEISYLRAIAVAYNATAEDKYVVLYYKNNEVSRLQLGHTGCHTLHFNPMTQALIPIGYRLTIQVYSIHPQYYDFTLVTELVGHSSLVTCITDIQDTSMVCTGDDTGWIRVWDLKTTRCLQILHAAKQLFHLYSLPCKKLLFTDSRVNLLNFESLPGSVLDKSSQLIPVSTFIDTLNLILYLCTSRQLRTYNLETGRLLNIFQITDDEEITAFSAINNKRFIVATDNGYTKIINQCGDLIAEVEGKGAEVSDINFDIENGLFIMNRDSDLNIWNYRQFEKFIPGLPKILKSHQNKPLRCIKNIHFRKHVKLIETNPEHSIIATSSNQNVVYIWDYEFGKLLCEVRLPSEITCIHIIHLQPFVVIGCNNGMVYLFEIERNELKINLRLINYINRYNSVYGSTDEFEQYPFKIASSVNQDLIALYICSQKGTITSLNIDRLLSIKNASNRKNNYNVFRVCVQNFENEYKKNQFEKIDVQLEISTEIKQICWQKKIHKDTIHNMNLFQSPQKHLISCSSDGSMKITRCVNGDIIASLNINAPLPFKWQPFVDKFLLAEKKLALSLKILNLIIKKYQNDFSINELKVLSVDKLVKLLNEEESQTKILAKKKLLLFNDEYSTLDTKNPADLKIKKTTLKQLQAYKRVYLTHNTTNIKQPTQKVEFTAADRIKMENSIEERDQIANLLSPSYLPKIINKGISEENLKTNEEYLNKFKSIFDSTSKKPTERRLEQKKSIRKSTTLQEYAKLKHYADKENQSNLKIILTNLNDKIKKSKAKLARSTQSLDVSVFLTNNS